MGKKVDYLFWISLFLVTAFGILGYFFSDVIEPYRWLNVMSHTAHEMLKAMWWGVVAGALFIGILSKVPREFIMSILGRGGSASGLFRAVGAGVLLDLCSHGILMVATKLYERGASAGQVVAFLLASPWNSFSLTLVLIGLIGWEWTVVFILLSMLVALIAGAIFDRLVAGEVLLSNPNEIDLPSGFRFWPEAHKRIRDTRFDGSFFKSILGHSIRDSRMVVRWLLFGILLAGLLRVFLDPAQFEKFFGPSLVGLLMSVFVATILEVCSEGSTPVAADILTRAKSPGNAFAFLMSGVATDYTEVMVLKDTTRSWKLALFLPLITVPQVMLIAWLINRYATG